MVELVLTMLLLGIVAAVVARYLFQGVRSYSVGQDRAEVSTRAGLAVERIAREARAVRSCADIAGPANPAATLAFTDSDGSPVSFSVASGRLQRGAEVLAEGVVSPSPFRFLDAAGAATASCLAPNDIWLIEIDLTVAEGGESQRVRSLVRPRNW